MATGATANLGIFDFCIVVLHFALWFLICAAPLPNWLLIIVYWLLTMNYELWTMNNPLFRYILYPKSAKNQAKSPFLSKIVLYSSQTCPGVSLLYLLSYTTIQFVNQRILNFIFSFFIKIKLFVHLPDLWCIISQSEKKSPKIAKNLCFLTNFLSFKHTYSMGNDY